MPGQRDRPCAIAQFSVRAGGQKAGQIVERFPPILRGIPLGGECDGLLQIGLGGVVVAAVVEAERPMPVRFGRLAIELDGLVEVLDGFGIVVHAVPGQSPVVVVVVVRLQRDGLVEIDDGGVVVVQLQMTQSAHVVRIGNGSIQRDGLVQQSHDLREMLLA